MPNLPTAHGDLDCADAEALLADAETENARLRAEVALLRSANEDLTRRLDNAVAQKNVAIDEAVAARSN